LAVPAETICRTAHEFCDFSSPANTPLNIGGLALRRMGQPPETVVADVCLMAELARGADAATAAESLSVPR